MTEPHDLEPDLERELEALGELRRRELAARPPEWDRLAAGEISVDEVRRLRLAAGDEPATVERGIELFRPYDELEQRRLDVGLRKRPSSVLRLLSAVGIVLAAAAALLLWVQWPNPTEDRLALADVPAIVVEPGQGIASVRSSDDARELVYAATTPLEWWVRPNEDVEDPRRLAIDVLACNTDGCRPIELDIRWVDEPSQSTPTEGPLVTEVYPPGTVRIRGEAGQLGLDPGDWTLRIGMRRPRHRLVEALATDPSILPRPDPMTEIELKIIE